MARLTRGVAGLLLVLAVPAWAADPIAAGPSFKVDAGQDGIPRRPDVAAGAAGNFVVVWEVQGSYSYQHPLFARTFDEHATASGPPVLLGPPNVNPAVSALASVAADTAGDFVVAWTQGSGAYDIAGQRGDAAGVLDGPRFTVASGIFDYFYKADVAADADGDFVVVWADRDDYDTSDVFGRRYDASGAPQGPAFAIKADTTLESLDPVVATDAAGNFVVVWKETPQYGDAWELRGQRFDAAGSPVGAEFQVASDAGDGVYTYQAEQAVASDSLGNFVVAWESLLPSARIAARRFDATGTPVGGPMPVADDPTDRVPDVAVADGGDFVVTWQDDSDVFARRFDAGHDAFGEPFQVNDFTTNWQREPAVAMDAAGNFVVAWSGYGDDPDTPNAVDTGVFARRFLVPQDAGIAATKLVVVDRMAVAGKAKVVYVAKNDPAIAKGAGGDPAALSGSFDVFYTDMAGSVAGSFVLPAPWRVATSAVAKYVNSLAPEGPGQAKVAVVKDGIAAKVRAKGLGDGPQLDLFAGPPSAAGGITTVLQIVNGNDGSARRLCSRFATDLGSTVTYRVLANGAGRKLIATGGVATACP